MDRIQNCCCNFYKHVAKVFYAMAFIDGEIRPEEFEAFEQTLKQQWLKKYPKKEDAVKKIIESFKNLRVQQRDADECFYEFVLYKKEHENLFTNSMRNILWEISCVIADRVNKKNKSELILLARLGKQLGLIKSRK